jgi:AraC family transcriptional regulator of adaptative response/methylated-DNA-[protein]-cysteine methyltransferase
MTLLDVLPLNLLYSEVCMDKEENWVLKESRIKTPIGEMIAIADQNFLYLLEFTDSTNFNRKIERFKNKLNCTIEHGKAQPISSIENELTLYFSGKLKEFNTAVHMIGTNFQRLAWQKLQDIPYADTRSYKQQADLVKNPKAVRAIANANAANQLAIIIPCHRVIQNDGKIGGYAGGAKRKKWLLEHEKKCINQS